MRAFNLDAAIAVRQLAIEALRKGDVQITNATLAMDLMNAHQEVGLDFEALQAAGNSASDQYADFLHDVFGIVKHMDRNTGKLTDCFVPRFALKQS